MNHLSTAEWERRLCGGPTVGTFNSSEIDGLPEPVQRYFREAIADGTPLATCVSLRMRGQIKVGRWLPFRAHQILNPHIGFIWAARAAGIIAGSDQYIDGVGVMNWKIASLFDVMHAEGPDVDRSNAGRGGAEGIWAPTALLPRFDVTWTSESDDHITAHHHVDSVQVDTELTIEPNGLVRSIAFQRWGDPDDTGTFSWHPFGGVITAHRRFAGMTVPSAGRIGWHAGTDRAAESEFFRYEINSLELPTEQSREHRNTKELAK